LNLQPPDLAYMQSRELRLACTYDQAESVGFLGFGRVDVKHFRWPKLTASIDDA
jgi:hypothetical protein